MSGPCCVDLGAKQTHEPVGIEVSIDGFETYKTGDGNSAIVIFTDIFGFSFINTRMLADQFAQRTGATVLVPDFFNGDPMNPNESNLFEKLPAWREKHPVAEACQMADRFIASIEDNYQSIQIIGFCYGAKPVVHLIIQATLTTKIKASVVAHPTFLVEQEASEIKRPILFLCAETDQRFTPDLRQHFEKTLAPTGLSTFIDFPGTVHGFVIRPDGTEHVQQQRDKAVQHAIEYFKKYF